MYGPHTRGYAAVLASNTTSTSAIALGNHAWEHIYLERPSHASGGTTYVQASDAIDGNFHRVFVFDPATGNQNELEFPVSGGSSVGGHHQLPAGLAYVKVETTETVANATTTFKFVVS